MSSVREICPGVYALDDSIEFCPGCGCLAMGMDPDNPADVREWTQAAILAVRSFGCEWATDEKAEEIAKAFNEEPWHDC